MNLNATLINVMQPIANPLIHTNVSTAIGLSKAMEYIYGIYLRHDQ
jgi:hypothetical protein